VSATSGPAGHPGTVPRRVRGVLAGAALLATAVCCGQGQGSGGAPAEDTATATRHVRDAFAATVDAGSALMRMHADLTASVDGQTESARMDGEGVFDFANRASDVSLTTPLGLRLTVRTVGTGFYEKPPPQLRKRYPGDEPWLRFDFEAADRAQYGAPLYVFRPGRPDDPWQVLGFLPAASQASLLGTERVGGTSTRHYRATVRLSDLAELGPPQTRASRQRFQQMVGLSEVDIQVWLDGDGRLRRLRLSVPLHLTGAEWTSTGGEVVADTTATVEFSDFGTPVRVDAPAPDQTHDLTPLVSRRGLAAVGEIVGII
jgi:hypothetical protein